MIKYYVFKDETIIGIADEARRLGNVEGELSPAQMKQIFAGITPNSTSLSFNSSARGLLTSIPEGNAETTLNMSNLIYTSSANAELPTIHKGNAVVVLDMSNLKYVSNGNGTLPTGL